MCGVVGFSMWPEEDKTLLPNFLYLYLLFLQYRGQESAGMVIDDDNLDQFKVLVGAGTVDQVFSEETLGELKGRVGIAHNRYSTSGDLSILGAQPFLSQDKKFALSFNGNLVQYQDLVDLLLSRGYRFKTNPIVDTEVIVGLLETSNRGAFREKLISDVLPKLKGTFSLVVLHDKKLYAVRDSSENRPLMIGRTEHGYVVASETGVFIEKAEEYFLQYVEGGTCVEIDTSNVKNPIQTFRWAPTMPKRCIFELIYFSRPDSVLDGKGVRAVQRRLGHYLFEEDPDIEADIVVPVPDSGKGAAEGYNKASGIPMVEALLRLHTVGRTFIKPAYKQVKQRGVNIKFAILVDDVRDKRLVLVDDSIVRLNTMPRVIKMLRVAGAREIHVRISSPLYSHPCYYGIDTNRIKDELVAKRTEGNIERIRKECGADSLRYLSLENTIRAAEEVKSRPPYVGDYGSGGETYCHACFSGDYFIDPH